ncbi:glycine zipper 2TM domain-containing protein [Zobellella aerophila]|uniref:Glycine zipper 2TM domain-containing protein n=1 Tax=Zobellella aerophila TaxID=870480 RepID=A0ABP6VA26_9GAMM
MKLKSISIVLALGVLPLAGCSTTDVYSGDVYRSSEANRAQNVTFGTIVSVRPVTIQAGDKDPNVLGSVGGGVVGGMLGHQVGGGSGRSLATAGGAILGVMAGSKIEDKASQVSAVELGVRTDAGENLVIVQKADRSWQAGQRVRLIGTHSNMIVAPY